MLSSLSDLLSPNDPLEFLDAVRQHRPQLFQTERAAEFSRLLPWRAFNDLLSADRILSGQIRFIRNGISIPTEMVIGRKYGARNKAEIQPQALQSHCRQGISVVVNGIDELAPGIASMNAILERELRATVLTNAYVSFGKGGAFTPHWDDHNVLILQLHGRKRWQLWGQPWRFPVKTAEYAMSTPPGPATWERTLDPGDVLYVPRGEVHAAQIHDGEQSLHLTVTIKAPRAPDLASSILSACLTDPVGRQDLPVLAAPEEKARWLAEMKALLHRAVDVLDLDSVLAQLDRDRPFIPMTSLGLIPPGAAGGIDAKTALQPALRRRIPIPPADRNGRIALAAGKESWTLDPAEAAILELALHRHTVTVEELCQLLPNLPPDTLVSSVEKLALKGLVILLDS